MQDYKLDNWTFIANKTMHAHINQVICEFVATYWHIAVHKFAVW